MDVSCYNYMISISCTRVCYSIIIIIKYIYLLINFSFFFFCYRYVKPPMCVIRLISAGKKFSSIKIYTCLRHAEHRTDRIEFDSTVIPNTVFV